MASNKRARSISPKTGESGRVRPDRDGVSPKFSAGETSDLVRLRKSLRAERKSHHEERVVEVAWPDRGAVGPDRRFVGRSVGGSAAADGPEVMARGPLHEAFAAPVSFNPTPGALIPKPPPDLIEEQPPDQKPQGGDVEWIPGYWAWDDQRQDYLWISGIWRDIPPGRQWVAGYWSQADGGFRWTSGFWSPLANNGRMSYLPPPPQSLEIGPNSPQPAPDFMWSPGSWAWAENRYIWRPGFWVQAQPEWVWVPPSYVPTPSGYVFIDGYWDHPIERRGMIYAPVAFSAGFVAGPGYVYSPTVSLSIGGLTANLFIGSGSYFFGNYYGVSAVVGRPAYVPWFAYQQQRFGYDPFYATMAANHWRDPQWARQIRTEYVYRVKNVEARPASTFAEQRRIVEERRARGEDVRGMEIAHAAGRAEPGRRMEPVRAEERAAIIQRQESHREAQQGRARIEAAARPSAETRPEDHRPQHLEIPRSPVIARASASPGGAPGHGRAAPPAHPDGHEAFRPTFLGHQEPSRVAGRLTQGEEPCQAPRTRSPRAGKRRIASRTPADLIL